MADEPQYFSPRTRGPPGFRAPEIMRAIDGQTWPATRDQLVARAQRNHAPDTVLRAIGMLPEERYRDEVDVAKAFDALAGRT